MFRNRTHEIDFRTEISSMSTPTDRPAPANASSEPTTPAPAGWPMLTHHAHVMLALQREPEATVRLLSERVGLTERAVQRILSELEKMQLLERRRVGRRNAYVLHLDRTLPHPLEARGTLRALIEPMLDDTEPFHPNSDSPAQR